MPTVLCAAPNTNTEGIQVYQKNLHLTAERKQILADDIDRYRNADDIWDSLRQQFTLSHYENSPLVQAKIEWFMQHQDYLIHSATRSAPYLYYIMQQAKKRHLPAELVLLPIIESAYNPFALNASSGAAGIWQMMSATASGYGVRQNWWYDGRRDVVTSTKAALNHLAYLQSFFEGNWLLAIAAYDTGEGNVLAAIRKNIRDGENTDYWSLPLAQETRDYVPQLLALATIISHPDQYPIRFPVVRNAPYLAQVDIGGQIDLKHAAYLAGLSLQKIKQLNPGYSRGATDPNGPYKIVLPIENVEQFTENFARSPLYQRVNWVHYRIKNGDTLPIIARRFNTTPSALHNLNPKLMARNKLKPGSSLLIPRPESMLTKTILASSKPEPMMIAEDNTQIKKPVATAPKAQLAASITSAFVKPQGHYTMQPGDTLYIVHNNENLDKIARHFHMTTQTLLAVNQISDGSSLHSGTQLIIPTHLSQNQNAAQYDLTGGDTVYVVKAGDTMEKIAQHFHMNPATIRLANLLASNDIQKGDQLVIPTHT